MGLTETGINALLAADLASRAWVMWQKVAYGSAPDCDLCGDTGYLPAPLGAWRPFCPNFCCAAKRRRPTWPPNT